ncbi:MAG: hypothetical protein ACOC3V_00275 [bacterium]
MGLISNLLDNIEFKGDRISVIVKSIVGVSLVGISTAYILGQFKIKHMNKLDNIEKLTKENVEKTNQLEKKIDENFNIINYRIDEIYNDGYEAFDQYRLFNNKQLKLIIDYNDTNKDLLKKIIDLNSEEKSKEIEIDLEKNKPNINYKIGVKKNNEEIK